MEKQTVTIPINLFINLIADLSHATGYIEAIKPDTEHYYRDSIDAAMEGLQKAMEQPRSDEGKE
jgi:hypothetical protein